ncbi:MAG TPA: tetratricopeptide repeat protein [Gemmatimonadales bacterium]|nr:tetratricopeptide repeat protein [Gemmatimonadales bacterium]
MIRQLAGGMLVAFAGAALARPVAAQETMSPVQTRLAGALDSRFVQPDCKVEGGDFRVSSGKTYLKTGIETAEDFNRASALRNGVRVITEAITTAGQGKSSAAWYYLGRLYLQQGDLVGADSAFTRAEQLTPSCKADIDKYRYRAWAALVNAGTTFRQAQQDDSALVMFRAANDIERSQPLAFVSIADIFNTQNQPDSALRYFGLAAATAPTDTNQVKLRNQAVFNYGVLLLNSGKAPEAVAQFRRYLTLSPGDASAMKALAQAYRAAGMADSAQALEHQLVANASTQPNPEEGLSDADLFDIAVKQFNEKNYQDAAVTFGRIIQRNPYNRDALFNQANAYLALQQGDKLAESADKLIAIEPLAEYDYTLKAQGAKLASKQDELFKAIVAREALPVNLEVQGFKLGATGAQLTGKVTGRDARDEANKQLPPKTVTVKMDFLDKDGNVVASDSKTIPPLKAGDSQPFSAEVHGEGIKSWRYTVR